MPSEKRGRGRPAGSRVDPAQRQAALLDAAERAIKERGPSVSLAEVAAEAGYVRSAVYAMYPQRGALMSALGRRAAQRLLAEITRRASGSTDLRQRMSLFFDVVIGWMAEEPSLHRALSVEPGVGVFEELATSVESMLVASMPTGDARVAAAAPWSRVIVGSAVAAGEWWLRTDTMTRDELVEHLTRLSWDGASAMPFGTEQIAAIDNRQL